MVEIADASMKVSSELSFDCADERVWPPGFRFHPTDEELVLYYLKRKICRKKLKLDMIRETDVYKWDPEELPGQSKLKTGDRQWFFFSPRDRKYPNGARSNRATRQGYWKATGKDRMVTCNSRTVGVKKTLVFYRGRAPSGDRTDWVMHEYTLDEDELKRCQNVKDYYALYKVYKKSGSGPKNGEQYGAPFKEENWLDDECQDVDNIVKAVVAVEHNEVASAENVRTKYSEKDLDDLLKEMMDEPVLLQPLNTDYGYTLSQVGGEDETESILLEPSYADSICLQPVTVTAANHQYFNQTSFNATEYVESRSQIFEVPDATADMSDPVEAQRFISAEDYLELDDLCLPEPTSSNVEKPIGNTQFEELNGLSEFDFFLDANMFIGEARDADPYTNQFDDHRLVSIPSVDEDQVNHQLWNLESHGSSSIVSHQGNRPISGVEANGSNGSGSLFSSALWSFVESIPSRPASASESPLVNRAFERMSSFSRIRANVRIYAADTSGGAAVKKSGDSNGGGSAKRRLIMLWAVGGLCGMFGLLVVKYKSLFNVAFGWTS